MTSLKKKIMIGAKTAIWKRLRVFQIRSWLNDKVKQHIDLLTLFWFLVHDLVELNYLKKCLIAFRRSHNQDGSSINGRFDPCIDVFRSHLELAGICARFSYTKSTGMPLLLATCYPLWSIFFLSLLCRVSQYFSSQTVMGNRDILLRLEYTMASILCLSTARLILGTLAFVSIVNSFLCGTMSAIGLWRDQITMSGSEIVIALLYYLVTFARINQSSLLSRCLLPRSSRAFCAQ